MISCFKWPKRHNSEEGKSGLKNWRPEEGRNEGRKKIKRYLRGIFSLHFHWLPWVNSRRKTTQILSKRDLTAFLFLEASFLSCNFTHFFWDKFLILFSFRFKCFHFYFCSDIFHPRPTFSFLNKVIRFWLERNRARYLLLWHFDTFLYLLSFVCITTSFFIFIFTQHFLHFYFSYYYYYYKTIFSNASISCIWLLPSSLRFILSYSLCFSSSFLFTCSYFVKANFWSTYSNIKE